MKTSDRQMREGSSAGAVVKPLGINGNEPKGECRERRKYAKWTQ